MRDRGGRDAGSGNRRALAPARRAVRRRGARALRLRRRRRGSTARATAAERRPRRPKKLSGAPIKAMTITSVNTEGPAYPTSEHGEGLRAVGQRQRRHRRPPAEVIIVRRPRRPPGAADCARQAVAGEGRRRSSARSRSWPRHRAGAREGRHRLVRRRAARSRRASGRSKTRSRSAAAAVRRRPRQEGGRRRLQEDQRGHHRRRPGFIPPMENAMNALRHEVRQEPIILPPTARTTARRSPRRPAAAPTA